MSTLNSDLPIRRTAGARSRFYVRVGIFCAAVGIIGFLPSYWIPMARGSLSVQPLAHLHALLFYGWLLFFVRQAWLVGSGDVAQHRTWGVFGVALATAMCFVGVGVAIGSIKHFEAMGMGPAARSFSVVPISGILVFAGLVVAALLNTRNPESHKRFMLAATATLLQPAFARWFLLLLAPSGPPAPPPIFVSIGPGILSDLVVVAAMLHDRNASGHVHRTYWIALTAMVSAQLIRIPLGMTGSWDTVASALVRLSP
jgi:hypothetical protein